MVDKVKLPLTGAELNALRNEWVMSTTDFAKMMGVDRRTPSRWESGAIAIPHATQMLIRLMQANHTVFNAVSRLALGYPINVDK